MKPLDEEGDKKRYRLVIMRKKKEKKNATKYDLAVPINLVWQKPKKKNQHRTWASIDRPSLVAEQMCHA